VDPNWIVLIVVVVGLSIIAYLIMRPRAANPEADLKAEIARLNGDLGQLKSTLGELKALSDTNASASRELRDKVDSGFSGSREELQQRLALLEKGLLGFQNALNETVNTKLSESSQSLSKSLTENFSTIGATVSAVNKSIAEVRQNLGQLDEASKRIFDVGADMRMLKDLLQSPKLRGGVGEVMLEQLLGNVLPPEHYAMQYSLGTERVDAIVLLPYGKVAVDSKFSLDSFKRMLDAQSDDEKKKARKDFLKDLKLRVDEIRTRYIRPDLGTVDFALMYLPAENLYYEAVNAPAGEESLLEYAMEHKVIPTSPFTFFAYLVSLAYGFRGMKVAEHAEAIRAQLTTLARELGRAQEDLDTLGRHIRNAGAKYDEVVKHFGGFSLKLEQYQALSSGSETAGELPAPNDSSPPDT
jgi:DNA recombination protein RmuC